MEGVEDKNFMKHVGDQMVFYGLTHRRARPGFGAERKKLLQEIRESNDSHLIDRLREITFPPKYPS
jgi:hypothetical protein